MGHIVILASFFCEFQSLDYFPYFLLYKRQKFTFYRKIGIFESIVNKTHNLTKKRNDRTSGKDKSRNTEKLQIIEDTPTQLSIS